jgi:hypothetical protein
MGRTFLQQETQIRNSTTNGVDAAYIDDIAPTQANFETNPTNLQTDLNNVRSQLHNLLNNQGSNWYADLITPSYLDAGSQRGVNDINTDLHAVERKRVLVSVAKIQDIVVPTQAKAVNNLLLNSNVTAGDTVTIGVKTYTFVAVLGAEGDVIRGATASDSLDNLVAAINHGAGSGVTYQCAVAHPLVTALAGAGDSLDVTSILYGTIGNSYASTSVLTDPLSGWTAALLFNGAGDVVILGVNELPAPTTAAVGAVTTEGTVIAYLAAFGGAALTEVGGASAVSPKNLWSIVDADTRDPILSGGRTIYALGQCETVTDGHTITINTPTRAQLSFVRINAAGDDLELVPVADIQGKEISYTSVKRVALLNLTEQDFLRGAEIDVPSAVTATRQVAYTNQGTTPVDVLTHSYLDLEGAGLVWQIRDDDEAVLFGITENSVAGTSTVQIGAATDVFDVNAVVNDFLNGVSVDTGAAGTTINVGVTANQIDAGGELTIASGSSGGVQDLNLVAADELNLTDKWRAGSTWSLADGVALSNASAEWSLFETNFGEVSLLNAINQAYASAAGLARGTKTYANVTATTAADTDVSLADGNLDVALPDMSQGTFAVHDVYLNGNLLRGGANAGANHDYYPGGAPTLNPAKLKFEFVVKINDVICVVPWNP